MITATLTPQPQRTVEFVMHLYLHPTGLVTLNVRFGPQTNLALALRMELHLASRIPRVVMVAGGYLEGNTTPSEEFNVVADPVAAQIVFTSDIPVRKVELKVCYQALITPMELEQLREYPMACTTAVATLNLAGYICGAGEWSTSLAGKRKSQCGYGHGHGRERLGTIFLEGLK